MSLANRIRVAFFAGMGFLVISGVVLPALHHVLTREPLPPLQRFAKLPEFSLEERGGEPLTLARLSGRVWIASFFFTHCPTICPRISTQMRKLQSDLAHFPASERRNVRLVSISIDPERDTIPRLAEYAALYDADPEGWLFARGEKSEVYEIVQTGFLLPAPQTDQSTAQLVHSSKLALVDATGTVRGYYEGTEGSERAGLLRDVRRLLHERPPTPESGRD